MKSLLLDHWLAKIIALALAVMLWAVIRRSIETTDSPSRFELRSLGEDRFRFGVER